jgi:hypothetical protein
MAVNIPIKTTGGDQAVADLNKVGEAGGRALDRIKAGTQPASAGLKALNEITSDLKDRLSDLSGNAGVVGSVFSKMGTTGLGFAAVHGGISVGLGKVAEESESLHRFDNIFSAMLKSTDQASGQTVRSLNEIADSMKYSTMATEEGTKQAEVALLAFGNVTGEAFGRTIKAGQDLSVVMGTDLKSATVLFARAMEDPEQGLTRLSRAGIVFTDQQKEVIKAMAASGDQAGVLNSFLTAVESKIGGAGEADASTVTGAFHRLHEAINQTFEDIGKSTSIGAGFTHMIEGWVLLINKIDSTISPDIATSMAAKFKEIQSLQSQIDNGNFGTPGVRTSGVVDAEQRITQLKNELKALTDLNQEQAKQASVAKAAGIAHQTQSSIEAQDAQLMARLNASDSESLDNLSASRVKDAAAAKQQSDARAKATQTITDQIAALDAEYYSLSLSDRERAIFTEEMKAENVARQAGIELTTQQKDAIEAEAGAIYDRTKATADQKSADDKAAAAAKKASDEHVKIAEEEVKKIDTTFHDGFVHALENGKGSWSSFTSSLFNTFKSTVADQIYKLFLQPFVVEIAASLIGVTASQSAGAAAVNAVTGSGSAGNTLSSIGSLTSLASAGTHIAAAYNTFSGGASLSENMNSGFATPMSSMFTAAYTVGAHMAGDWLANKFGATGTGGNIGGAIGAAIGTVILPGLGTIVGSFIGSFVGSFIGNSQPSNYTALAHANLSTGTTAALHGDSPNANTQGGANQLAADAVSISQMLTQITGATQTITDIQTQVGQRDRILISNGAPTNGQLAPGQSTATEMSFAPSDMKGAISGLTQMLIGGLSGVTDAVKTQMEAAVKKIDFSNSTQATADLQFAFQYLNGTLLQAPKAISNMQQSINQLNTAFANATAQATRLGLSTAQVAADQAAALKALTDGFNASIQDQILAITDPMAQALQVEAKSAAARLQEAIDGGANLVAVEQLTALERDQIIQKYAGQSTNALSTTAKSILDFVHQITGTTSSPLATQTSLANAKAYYQDTLGKAQGGDTAAQGSITAAAKDYLDLEQQMYASSSQYFTVFNGVTASLTMLANGLNVTAGVIGPGGYTGAQQTALDAINATVNYVPPAPPTDRQIPTTPSRSTAQAVDTTPQLDAIGAELVRGNADRRSIHDEIVALRRAISAQQTTLDRLAHRPRRVG